MGGTKMSRRRRKDKRKYEYGFVTILSDYISTRGYMLNKSKNGIGVFIHEPLNINENIEIICNHHWKGAKQASVMWCRHYKDDIYRAGFSFNYIEHRLLS
jgi:hypothetical protein